MSHWPVENCTAEISALSTWDGWPDGRFQCFLSPQEVADTHELEINWVCKSLKARRGKHDASTWQRGKESRRQCVGVLECSSRSHVSAVNFCASEAARLGAVRFGVIQSPYPYMVSDKHVPYECATIAATEARKKNREAKKIPRAARPSWESKLSVASADHQARGASGCVEYTKEGV
ncbi:hypothetical protein C8J57DRAFT_1225187 [Mycena rebaudengoi]|nr:hypothetical protein C8J57DRAFT_1225187 [Mycena rebaudengoi]